MGTLELWQTLVAASKNLSPSTGYYELQREQRPIRLSQKDSLAL